MAEQGKNGISWTDETWNPIRGCSRVSEGCRNCYAESVAYRFSGEGLPYEGLVRIRANGERVPEWNGTVRVVEEHMLDPLKWKRPRRIFVNSMSDLFHPNVTDETLDRIFAVMALSPQHTFQVLTKRPERMLAYLSGSARISIGLEGMFLTLDARSKNPQSMLGDGIKMSLNDGGQAQLSNWPLPNVWLGASVENQAAAEERIPLLSETPAAVRWISAEPLLGGIWLKPKWLDSLDWVVVGGESGPGARPMHPDWARSLGGQCKAAGVAFHFKQWGAWSTVWERAGDDPRNWPKAKDNSERFVNLAGGHGTSAGEFVVFMRNVGKHKAGRLLDGRVWDEYPA